VLRLWLPTDEVTHLWEVLSMAYRRAEIGYTAHGRRLIKLGLARAWDQHAGGAPWATELVARYEQALDEYCKQ
jgi:hypothetical protein